MTRVKIAHLTTVDMTLRFLLLSQLEALQQEGYAIVGVSRPGPWIADLRQRGIAHRAVPSLGRGWTPLADLRALMTLWRLFRREKFALVHTHTPKGGVLGRLAARLSGVPIVVNTVHGLYGLDHGRLSRRFLLWLERMAARGSDFEFCQSREDLDLLRKLRIVSPDRSTYLGNGVDLAYFDPAAVPIGERKRLYDELGLSRQSLIVGTVGRLVWEKGYREFLDAAAHVRRIRPDVTFIAVGPTDESKRDAVPPQVIQRAERAGVRFLGMRGDMRELYSIMSIFVLASHREGFPRSAIEAAAMEKPLILTDIRGCREVVTHGQNGVLVPARQSAPLAEAILRLAQDETLRRRFGAESRRRALQEFDERRVIERLLDAYRELLFSQRRQHA